jgi:hypothetical protein
MAIFTVGHSTISSEAFVDLVKGKLTTVIDVRSHPTSRWPQFRREEMEKWLPEAGIGYEWWPGLGGWDVRHENLRDSMLTHGVDLASYMRGKFPKQRIAQNKEPPAEQEKLPIVKPEWTNVGLRDYSWFMSLPEFVDDAEKLIARGANEDVGIMCCEALYFKCHRSMIADYLLHKGVDSTHLQPTFRQKNKIKYVSGSKGPFHSSVIGNRLSRYDPEIVDAWPSRVDTFPSVPLLDCSSSTKFANSSEICCE